MNAPHVSPEPGPEEQNFVMDPRLTDFAEAERTGERYFPPHGGNVRADVAVQFINEAELRGRQQATENAGKHWEQVIRGLNTKSGTWVSNWMTIWLRANYTHRSLMESEAITWGLE